MAKQVMVGGIEQSSINIIVEYFEKVYTDLELKTIGSSGVGAIVSGGIKNPNVVLIVLSESMYNSLVPKVKTLSNRKVFKYTTDAILEEYCQKMTGISSAPFSKPVPPDEDLDLPKLAGVVEDVPIEIQDFSSNTDYEETVSRLTDEVAQRDMVIRNLEQQLKDSVSGSSDDEKELIAEIKRLNNELEEYKIKASKSEFADKRIAELSELKSKVDNYEVQVSGLKTQIDALTEDNNLLNTQLNDSVDEIDELNNSISELNKTVEAKVVELNSKNKELSLLQEKINTFSGVETNIETLTSTVATLTLDLQNKELDYKTLEESKEKVDLAYSELVLKQETLVSELNQVKSGVSEKEAEISALVTERDTLSERVKELETTLVTKNEENDLIREKIAELRGKANNSAEVSEELKKALEERENELTKKQEEFEKQKADFELIQQERSETTKAIDILLGEKKNLEDKVVELTEQLLNLESSKKSVDEQLQGYLEKIQTLEVEKTRSENTVSSLQSQLMSCKATSERVVTLENELLEERRRVTSLTSELEVMKKIDDSGKVADLRIEVAQLKHKLSEFSSTNAELKECKQRCTALELQLAEAEVKSKSVGVFSQMSNFAYPKVACDCKMTEITGLSDNFICVTSGSSESIAPTYQLIRKTCQKYRDKRCLILDLSTDTCIDREFATEKVISPIDWLQGSQPFTNFISKTKFPNVKVISTGLAYLNDLYFLQVDWKSRLIDLQGFADVVIIYIGCLNNTVTKVLFNTFNSCMRSFVITKATPINLRTVILTLTGLVSLNNSLTTIGCVNFDAKTSKLLYQKLADKYNAQIYTDTDVISL